MPHLKSRDIVHERQEDLPVEVEARELLNGGIFVAELDLLIEHGEVPVHPSEARFDEQDPQLGEAGEGPREDPERQVLGQGERRKRREDALARRGVASKDVPEGLLDPVSLLIPKGEKVNRPRRPWSGLQTLRVHSPVWESVLHERIRLVIEGKTSIQELLRVAK